MALLEVITLCAIGDGLVLLRRCAPHVNPHRHSPNHYGDLRRADLFEHEVAGPGQFQ